MADKTVQELGGINIWVNNAGIYPFSPVVEMSDEQWDSVLDINLRGTFIGAREAAKRMIVAQRGGDH
ncbi:MAG TPA: SDR family oxidoreductase [Ktedonobacteraceae bacterium]|nr:SDR family oxidoreductase [Ktedonobacteraceae bacterium]